MKIVEVLSLDNEKQEYRDLDIVKIKDGVLELAKYKNGFLHLQFYIPLISVRRVVIDYKGETNV